MNGTPPSHDVLVLGAGLAGMRAAIEAHAQSTEEANHARVREEIGDLLFVTTNIARHMQVEPEAALKLTNRKFRRRFGYIESKLSERNRKFDETTLNDLEELWQRAKATEPPEGTKSTRAD